MSYRAYRAARTIKAAGQGRRAGAIDPLVPVGGADDLSALRQGSPRLLVGVTPEERQLSNLRDDTSGDRRRALQDALKTNQEQLQDLKSKVVTSVEPESAPTSADFPTLEGPTFPDRSLRGAREARRRAETGKRTLGEFGSILAPLQDDVTVPLAGGEEATFGHSSGRDRLAEYATMPYRAGRAVLRDAPLLASQWAAGGGKPLEADAMAGFNTRQNEAQKGGVMFAPSGEVDLVKLDKQMTRRNNILDDAEDQVKRLKSELANMESDWKLNQVDEVTRINAELALHKETVERESAVLAQLKRVKRVTIPREKMRAEELRDSLDH